MSVSESENFVMGLLREMGFSVSKIPEGTRKTPDLEVRGATDQYLIEVKTKRGSSEELARFRADLEAGRIAEVVYDDSPSAAVAKRVRTAADQLAATGGDAFRLVWLLAQGVHPAAQLDQLVSTLYGTTTCADFSDGGSEFAYPCYFFHYNAFWRQRSVLDGAIVSTQEEGRFCVNPYSSKYHALLESALCAEFGRGVVDPIAEEEAGRAFVVDENVDRSDPNGVIGFLRAKYELPELFAMGMKTFAASGQTKA